MMPQKELSSDASRFISSLVKSLQIICNGHVDFNESIELVGHINIRVDHKFKYDYIVDEHVSKEGQDSSVFLSNSYYSSPPHRENIPKDFSVAEGDLSLQTGECKQHGSNAPEETRDSRKNENSSCTYDANVESAKEHQVQEDNMVLKLEGDEESNECMIIPSTSGDYESSGGSNVAAIMDPSSDGLTEDTQSNLRAPKRHNTSESDSERAGKVTVQRKKVMPRRTTTNFPKPKFVQTKPRKFSNPEEVERIDELWSKTGNTYGCNSCAYSTTYRNRVRAHCRSVHMGIPRKYKGNEKGFFVCDKCGKEFTSNRGFRMHTLSKHLNQYPYHCQECSKGFMSLSTYRDHMNMHAGIALQCMGCETLFYTEYGLKRHLLKKHPDML